MSQFLDSLMNAGVPALSALIVIYVFSLIRNKQTDYEDVDHIAEKNNFAVGLRRGSFILAMGIAMSALLTGTSLGIWNDCLSVFGEGTIIGAFLLLVFKINDKLFFKGIENDEEVENGNVAIALAEAGNLIAVGLILNGAFSGASNGWLMDLKTAGIFAGLGEVALLIGFSLYQSLTPYDDKKELLGIDEDGNRTKEPNTAAGLAIFGMFIALGLILRQSIQGDFQSWTLDIQSFAYSFAVGVTLLIIGRLAIDKMFLLKTSIRQEIEEDQNNAALILYACSIIMLGYVIASAS